MQVEDIQRITKNTQTKPEVVTKQPSATKTLIVRLLTKLLNKITK